MKASVSYYTDSHEAEETKQDFRKSKINTFELSSLNLVTKFLVQLQVNLI